MRANTHRPAPTTPGEGELFEALRLGSSAAFTELARRYQPALLALALAYTPGEEAEARGLIRQAWEIALSGLDMFAWRCSLRAWLTGVLAGIGRPCAVASSPPALPQERPPAPAEPSDWQDLPWGERWSGAAWTLARDTVAALPLAEREVIVLAGIVGWEPREVCDALGLTEARQATLLEDALGTLHDALATFLGENPAAVPANLRVRRAGPVGRVLADLTPQDGPHDPVLDQVFQRWRATRRRARFTAALRRLASR